MHTLSDLLASHPGEHDVDLERLTACISACAECSIACEACADACLDEGSVADLVSCVRADHTCADLCGTTAAVLSRRPVDQGVLRRLLEACAAACAACAAECEQHARMHEHCRLCAEACRTCEQACQDLLTSLT